MSCQTSRQLLGSEHWQLGPLAAAAQLHTTGIFEPSEKIISLSPPADVGSSGITRGCLPAGTLPQQWADSGSLPQLQILGLSGNQLAGTLPAQWGVSQTALPGLQVLELANNSLTGSLPPQWGTDGFQVSGVAIINSIVTCSKQVDSAKRSTRCSRWTQLNRSAGAPGADQAGCWAI